MGRGFTGSMIAPRSVVRVGDDLLMACPICTQLDRDERLLEEAVEEIRETRRYALSEEKRAAVEAEELMLAELLARIVERRAA
jgi:hypothetical protein